MIHKADSFVLSICILLFSLPVAAEGVWQPDLGNGTFKNPVIYADYSDPDVIRVGDDFYMTASSFNCIPGLPLLHSKDMVSWKLVNHALKKQAPFEVYSLPQHGNGVYAPSIRHHQGVYYIFYGDPDFGVYALTASDPLGEWSEPTLVKPAKGIIDPCPLWDEDGKMYVSHAFAGSRAGLNSVIAVFPVCPEKLVATGETRIVFDGHVGHRTIEGTKFHKRNGYYYIFTPAGGVATGWQTVLRSRQVYGPYEAKIVMKQGNTSINGPHQGAWVDTSQGENWFYHFQDKGAYGRVVHLQPMRWTNDWPVIGVDADGDGCGEPVASYKKPAIPGKFTPIVSDESDEFNDFRPGLQWQWHANANPLWAFSDVTNGVLKLYSFFPGHEVINLWSIPNLLLQKFPAPEFTVTTKLTFHPDHRFKGERTGLVVMGLDYALLDIENSAEGLQLSQKVCVNAEKLSPEQTNASVSLTDNTIYLRVQVGKDAQCIFSFSTDNRNFQPLGSAFKAKQGKWIGAKTGLYCIRPVKYSDGGWVDIDWFRVTH